jgi:hypothetical protein
MYTGVGILPTLLLMGGSVLLAVHSALRVLPQFALIEPVGRHCPEAVLRRALKEGGLQPEEAAALAAQLGVELPPEKATPRRRLSWRPPSIAGSERSAPAGPPDSAARRVLRRLLSIKPTRGASIAGSEAGDAGTASEESSDDEREAPGSAAGPSSGRAGSRRSLEGLKSASMADLLRLLSNSGVPPGSTGAPGASSAAATTPSAAAATAAAGGLLSSGTPRSGRSSLPGCGASDGGTLESFDGQMRRPKSASNLAAMLQHTPGGGHGGGGGHGHGASEPSSNVELAGEMLRALLLKQARAGQPITPHAPLAPPQDE